MTLFEIRKVKGAIIITKTKEIKIYSNLYSVLLRSIHTESTGYS